MTHSRAGTITIEVTINENQVEATVEDDGRGFEPGEETTRASGAGLASMKERAALLGDTVGLMSTPGKGTRIEVYLPLLPRSRR